MSTKRLDIKITPEEYWERAGRIGFAQAMFTSDAVEKHINGRLREVAVEMGHRLGLTEKAHVLDLGCGDGSFANSVLACHFAAVDGIDLSAAGIERAQAAAPRNSIHFTAGDITRIDYSQLPRYDGIFLMGILHHVPAATAGLLHSLGAITDRLVILEPNGNHLLRKLLELTPAYRAAGEHSFRIRRMQQVFRDAGFQVREWRRLNLFPNFTPEVLFRLLRPWEPLVERTPGLRALCTVNMWGCRNTQTSQL